MGTFITRWGSKGMGDGQFQSPNGIATDSAGNVYVSDSNHNRIQKFSPPAGPETTITSGVSGPAKTATPTFTFTLEPNGLDL